MDYIDVVDSSDWLDCVKVPGLPFNPTKDLPARQTAVYAKYFPQSIFASYTSAHDVVQTGFYKDEVRLL